MWGPCSTSCIGATKVNSVEYVATHYAFLLNKHHSINLNCQCPYHGNVVWSMEKFLDPGHEFDGHSHQTIVDGTIYKSCSSYMNRHSVKHVSYLNNVSLSAALNSVSSLSFYDIFIFNCKNFARLTYRDVKSLDY